MSSIAGRIRDLKGPLDYDRVLLRPAGQAIMAGLVQGIDEGTGSLRAQARRGHALDRREPLAAHRPGARRCWCWRIGAASRQVRPVIHEHYHVHIPGGSVLVGTLDEAARVLSPHVTRHQQRTAARKGRGR